LPDPVFLLVLNDPLKLMRRPFFESLREISTCRPKSVPSEFNRLFEALSLANSPSSALICVCCAEDCRDKDQLRENAGVTRIVVRVSGLYSSLAEKEKLLLKSRDEELENR